MPRGVPKAGYRRSKRHKALSLEEVERNIVDKVPYYVEELEKLTKPYFCPHCGNENRIIDKDVAMYLIDRAMGKPKQKQEIDITEKVQFNADQLDRIIEGHPILSRVYALAKLIANYPDGDDKIIEILDRAYEIAKREILPEGRGVESSITIEGEYSEAVPENTVTDME